MEGVWHCDCDPRLPADKFQTKNGGKNHGRWCKRNAVESIMRSADLFVQSTHARNHNINAVLSFCGQTMLRSAKKQQY
jgi:hypothetical protein